ncbi:MAG: glycosyltransferase [Alphaproteobacteria bacterium]
MRILHVISSLARELGGPSQACVGMAEAVASLGHDVRICTSRWDGAGRLVDATSGVPQDRNGVTYFYYDTPPVQVRGFSPAMVRALPGLIRDVDLVHLHSLYLAHSWATGDGCHRLGVPYIIRPHGTLDPYIWRRKRWRKRIVETIFQDRVNRNAAAFHFTTQEEMELAAPYIPGRPGFVAPLGVDLDRFADLPPTGRFRRRHPELGDRPIMLFYGRLNFKKGLDVLIPAFAEAVRRGYDLALVIAGPDHGMAAKAREWVEQHGIADRCVFTGMLDGEHAIEALTDAELFILPSFSENFGISVVEAMACGLPVLISDRVNIWREVVADGAGLVGPPEIPAFADMIDEAMANPERRLAMSAAARLSVGRRFTWDRIGARLESVYADIVAGRPFEPLMEGLEPLAIEAVA